MRNFQDNFETHKQSFISAFSFCMTVPLSKQNMLQIIQISFSSNEDAKENIRVTEIRRMQIRFDDFKNILKAFDDFKNNQQKCMK